MNETASVSFRGKYMRIVNGMRSVSIYMHKLLMKLKKSLRIEIR